MQMFANCFTFNKIYFYRPFKRYTILFWDNQSVVFVEREERGITISTYLGTETQMDPIWRSLF